MKNSREFWIRDLEQLLDETVVKDAVAEIMQLLDDAVQALQPDSRALISRYFDGATLEDIGREHSITPQQAGLWVDKVKRELAQKLRLKCQVKQ